MPWQMDVEPAERTERLDVHNSSDVYIPEAVLDAAVDRSCRDMAEQHAGGDTAAGCDVALRAIVGAGRDATRRDDP